MTESSFVHLHVHSEFSLLDGATKVKALCRTAADHGAPAIALTDHGVMYGAMEFYTEATSHGLTPIIGVEAYLAPRGRFDRTVRNEAHVTLLAQDEEGYHNLVKLVSKGFTEGYYYKPRVDMDLLAQHSAGIICLSGCLSGLVQTPLLAGDYAGAKAAAQAYKDIFGDRFYLEIMRHGLHDQQAVEDGMRRLAVDMGVPLVATNDSHYLKHEDHPYHDVLLCIGTGKTLATENRFKFDGDQYYVKTPDEMRSVFADIPEACDTTLEIAKRVDVKFSPATFHIPEFPIPEEKRRANDGTKVTPEIYLRRLCMGGLKKRYGAERIANDPELLERLNYELKVINEMGFASYFLIVWDFIKYARDNDIPVGPGRGSAVGSIVSYCLGITSLDPLRFGLYFERFLNPSRVSMPDIDTDFCIEGRERVIQYVTRKYGAERVSQIITFGTLAGRGAIRDAGRVLDLPLPIVDRVAKLIPGGPKSLSIEQARKQIAELAQMERASDQVRQLLDIAEHIEGFVRNAGTHAAGIVISDKPITEYLPISIQKKTGDSDTTVNTQFDMDWIEKIGLLKMDFLGLRNLTVMREAERSIQRAANTEFRLASIPDDDVKTFTMLSRGETSGVFQLESDGMRRMLTEMKPDRLDDIVAAVALYRPGPMELIPQYIGGKQGRIVPSYLHPKLEPILADTYGVAVYQEQIMQIARDIAGFSMADADELRKVMGKKIKEKVAKQREKFVAGAKENGVDEQTAERIFDFVEPFAGYGFNKSHAVAYGWISYQTAYLKANYPLQYMAALMTSMADDTDKLVEYLNEAEAIGVKVLPPDINSSAATFTVVDDCIRFGFGAIKGITPDSVAALIMERNGHGPFTDLFDMISRSREAGLQKRTVEILIKVGACDSLPGHRTQQIASLDIAFERANRELRDKAEGQLSFLGDIVSEPQELRLLSVPEASAIQLLNWEYEGLGIYVSGHPIDQARSLLAERAARTIAETKTNPDGRVARAGGLVRSTRRFTTKSGQLMLTCKIEDRTGAIDVVLFPSQYDEWQRLLVDGAVVLITGAVRTRDQRGDSDVVERNLHVTQVEELIPAGSSQLTLPQSA